MLDQEHFMANKPLSRALMAGALLFCVLLITPQSFADSFARIVRLSDMEGSVDVDRGTGQGFEKALLNMPITQGVRLKTGLSGRAEVEFENGSVIRLVGDSGVSFTQLSLRTNGEHVNEIQVEDGVVYVDYRHKGGDEFRLAVGNHPFDLTKDVRFRMQVNRGEVELAVFKGELNVQGATQSAKVKKGESFTLDLNDGAKYSLAKGITPLNTDGYEQEREQYVQQYANQNHGSPYAYGYSDLNRYGSFFDAPGYGLVWQPTAVGAGWDPYSNGYWSLYPGSGYVWVSSYAWGWTPYRYGQWMFLSGRGWVWRPGGWNQWNRGVVVNSPPPMWRGPTPPTQGSGPTVPVGKPIPPPHRTLNTEDLSPRRPDRLNPVAPNGEAAGGTAQSGAPTKSMSPSRPVTAPATSNVAPSAAPSVAPMAPTTIQTQPTPPTRTVNEPARMNKGVREYNMDAERPASSATGACSSTSTERTVEVNGTACTSTTADVSFAERTAARRSAIAACTGASATGFTEQEQQQ